MIKPARGSRAGLSVVVVQIAVVATAAAGMDLILEIALFCQKRLFYKNLLCFLDLERPGLTKNFLIF